MLSGCGPGNHPQQRLQKASAALSQGHYRTAEIQLKNVLQKAPKNAEAWLMLGRVSLASGQYADAVEQLQRAQAAGMSAAKIKTPLVRAYLGNNQYKKVIALLKPGSDSAPALDATQLTLLGDAYAHLRKMDSAQAAFASALEKHADFAPALVGQARLAELRNKPQRAQDLLDKALQADSSYAPAYVARGEFAYRRHACKAAIPPLRKAIDAPVNALPLDRVYLSRAYLADCLMRTGDAASARPQIDKLMAAAPDNPYANYLQALLNFKDKDYSRAVVHLQRVLKVAPNQVNALTLLGLVKIAQNDPGLAEVYLKQAVQRSQQNIPALKLLANLYIQQGQADEAVNLLQNAHLSNQDNPAITAMLSAALVRAGKAQDAMHTMQSDGGVMDTRPDLQMSLVRLLASAGDTKAAGALIDQVKPKGESDRLQTAHMKIRLQLQQRQVDKALATAQDLVKAMPDNVVAKRMLASTYVAAGKPDKARSTLQALVDADPDDYVTRLDLGLLALRERNYQQADARFSEVHKQKPKDINAMLGLARSAALQGKNDKAIDWLARAHASAPKSEAAALALVRARLANGQASQALPVVAGLVAAHTDNAALMRLQGIVQLSAKQTDRALDSFRKAVKLAPKEPAYQLDLARAQLSANHVEQAVDTLKALRSGHPKFLAAAPVLAMAELRQGQPDAALAEAENLSKQANGQVPAAVLKGDVLAAQGKYAAAAKSYAQAYKAKPSGPVAVSLFNARRRAGVSSPAESLSDWLSRHPNDIRVRLMLAQWQQGQRQPDRAQTQYQRVLKADPHNVIALNNLALLYAGKNDQRALEMAERAHKSQPGNPAVEDTLGWLRVQNGNLKGGLPLLEKAASSTDAVPDIQYHLAAALVQTGQAQNITRARQLLKQVLNQNRSFDSRAAAEQLSEKLSTSASGS